MKGIGIVNLVHAYRGDYHPLDFRVYAPAGDGKTKNDHFRDMLRQAFEEKGIKAQTILFDNGYAAAENLKFLPPVNFPVIAYEFEANCKLSESFAAS